MYARIHIYDDNSQCMLEFTCQLQTQTNAMISVKYHQKRSKKIAINLVAFRRNNQLWHPAQKLLSRLLKVWLSYHFFQFLKLRTKKNFQSLPLIGPYITPIIFWYLAILGTVKQWDKAFTQNRNLWEVFVLWGSWWAPRGSLDSLS